MKKINELPFDLFSRNIMVKTIVDKIFRNNNETLSILDLGGYSGRTEHFFKDDDIDGL